MGLFSFIHLCKSMADDVNKYKKDPNFQYKNKVQTAFCGVVVSLFLMIYIGLSMTFTTGLLIYHTKIIKQNLTTKEEMKRFYRNPIGNPYIRNSRQNWVEALSPVIRKESVLEIMRNNKSEYYSQLQKRKIEEEKIKEKETKTPSNKETENEETISERESDVNKKDKEIKEKDIHININDDDNKNKFEENKFKKYNENIINNNVQKSTHISKNFVSTSYSSLRKRLENNDKLNEEDVKIIQERNKAIRKKNDIGGLDQIRKKKLEKYSRENSNLKENRNIVLMSSKKFSENKRYESENQNNIIENNILQSSDNNSNLIESKEKKEKTGEEKVQDALNVFGNNQEIKEMASIAFLPKASRIPLTNSNLPKRIKKNN